jgi:hypothetical protein
MFHIYPHRRVVVKNLGRRVPSRIALSTSWKPLEASSTDFAGRGAPRPDLNTLPTWIRIASAKPVSW